MAVTMYSEISRKPLNSVFRNVYKEIDREFLNRPMFDFFLYVFVDNSQLFQLAVVPIRTIETKKMNKQENLILLLPSPHSVCLRKNGRVSTAATAKAQHRRHHRAPLLLPRAEEMGIRRRR